MKKVYLIFSLSLIIIGCATNKSKPIISATTVNNKSLHEESKLLINNQLSTDNEAKPKLIGGWAPVFFNDLNKTSLNKIVYGIKSGQVRRATISYPKSMEDLASQIQTYLERNTGNDISMQLVKLKNTKQVQYNMSQVIVTLYFYTEK